MSTASVYRVRPQLHLRGDPLRASGVYPNKSPQVAGPFHPSALNPNKGEASRGGGVQATNSYALAGLGGKVPQGLVFLQDSHGPGDGLGPSREAAVVDVPGLEELWHLLTDVLGEGGHAEGVEHHDQGSP